MNPYQPDDRVRRKTDGALGTFRRQDPDGRVVVRWDGDGVDFTAEPWDLEQAPSGELTDADLDALTKAAEGRGGLWREVAAMTAELRARRAQDTPSDPAAWTHPDEEEESDVQRALACAHGPDEAVSGWPTVARVLAVEVERLRALVRAPGAVAAAPAEDEVDALARLLAVSNGAPWDYVEGGCDDADPYYRDARAVLAAGWKRAPAPSAGEDEAAVERAARAIYAEVYPGWPWEDDDDAAQGRDDCRRAARAAFAAARGPRTQDDT